MQISRWLSLCACTLSLVAPVWGADPDAVAYQNNPAHDGSVTFQNFSTTPTKLWSINLSHSLSYPLIAQGEVFVTSDDNSASSMTLYALNAQTGATNWSVSLARTFRSDSATYENGAIFLVNSNLSSSTMNAYDATTGKLLWSSPLPGQNSFSSPPTALNGVVYTGGSGNNGTLYAMNETDGHLLWTAPVSNGDHSSPVVTSDGVYASYGGPQTYKFNPATGAQIWHYDSGVSAGGGRTAAYANGLLLTSNSFSAAPLITLNAATGGSVTTYNNLPGKAITAAAAGIGYRANNFLNAFDLATGNILWTQSIANFTTAPLIINGVVFEGSDDGHIYEFNGTTGALLNTINVGIPLPSPDEQNVSQPLTGMTAGDGLLAVPTGSVLTVYAVPEPATFACAGTLATLLLLRRRK